MGLIFKLEHANLISNLTYGNINAVYDYLRDEDNKNSTLDFLHGFSESIFTSYPNRYKSYVENMISAIRFSRNEYTETPLEDLPPIDYRLYNAISSFSKSLSRFKYHFLILQKFDYATSSKILLELQKVMDQDALYLWPTNYNPNSVSLLNAFPAFDLAIENMGNWPGILVWQKMQKYYGKEYDGAFFIPIKNNDEIIEIARATEHSKGQILRYKPTDIINKDKNHYLVHMSDVHFGKGVTERKSKSISTFLSEKIRSIKNYSSIDLLISGDCIDTPNESYLQHYLDFHKEISKKVNRVYTILGNHDLSWKGIGVFSTPDEALVNKIRNEIYKEKVVMLSKSIVLLLFDSNISSNFGTGLIGQDQMNFFQNELSKIESISTKKIIVVLHHHIIKTPINNFSRQTFMQKSFNTLNLVRLKDADIFIDWLIKNKVSLVLNGHMHEPYLDTETIPGLKILSCGSTGGHTSIFGRDYKTLNILKFDGNNLFITFYAVNNDDPSFNIYQVSKTTI